MKNYSEFPVVSQVVSLLAQTTVSAIMAPTEVTTFNSLIVLLQVLGNESAFWHPASLLTDSHMLP